MKSKKRINKYYVGAEHIADAIASNTDAAWTNSSLEEAIKNGKRLLEEENRDCVIIVEVVRIIRRADNPIIVEKV